MTTKTQQLTKIRFNQAARCLLEYYAEKLYMEKARVLRQTIRFFAQNDSNFDKADFASWTKKEILPALPHEQQKRLALEIDEML